MRTAGVRGRTSTIGCLVTVWPVSKWTNIVPRGKFYLFKTFGSTDTGVYEEWPSISEVSPENSVGIVTARDSLAIQWSTDDVWDVVSDVARGHAEDVRSKYRLGKDVCDWKVEWAQEDLRQAGPSRHEIAPILYRPFDTRFTYYTGQSRGFLCRPRAEVMGHMLAGQNLALITSRMTKGEVFRHAQVTRNIAEVICMSPKTSNNGFVFPIYLYPGVGKDDLSLFSRWRKVRTVVRRIWNWGSSRSLQLPSNCDS